MNRQESAKVPVQRNMSISTFRLDRADIVIVGNGIAGLTAAVEARRLAPDKRVVIITEQIHPTINTPALKQFAVGKLEREQLLAYPAGTERAERIHVVTARVDEIHARSKYVCINGGNDLLGFGYNSLLLATGSAPLGLRPDLPGRDFDGVCALHRLQDYLNLRRRLSEVSEAVVIGGGAHAIETVMGLLHWGIAVHWLIRGEHFMHRILDRPASEMVLERVRRAGCKVYTETEALGIMGRVGVVAGVITNHQQMIPCQLVLACTGTSPVTTLAEHCTVPLRNQGGILVDDQLHTSAPDIYAAGDVAALKNPQTGVYETRAQWYSAASQGRRAAAAMTGHEELTRRPFGVQWHATQLGELSMLTVGDPLSLKKSVTTLTDTSQGSYRRMAIVDDRLIGYLSLGPTQPDSMALKRIIDEEHPIRDIIKPLLKGTFDACSYLSQQHSRAAHSVLTSAKLPAISVRRNPISHVQLLPLIDPLIPAQASSEPDTDTSLPLYPNEESEKMWQTQPVLNSAQEDMSRSSVPQPIDAEEDEEISPFTGNLPSISKKIVESTLAPALSEKRSPSGSLWSYAKTQKSTRSSGSLWSYRSEERGR
jgi:NAD(P)H-nitrite reductase large subunit